jgi:undecaprenyl-diphosphatase
VHQLWLQHLLELDRSLIEASAALRWGPATAFFVLMSATFVKGPLFIVVGFVRDLKNRALPLTAIAVALSLWLGDRAATGIKHMVERPRPPHPGGGVETEALVHAPSTYSFPSGHATTSFATAMVVAILVPRLRWPALAVATLVAVSRPYLGVHFWLDVLAGAALGSAIGAAIALTALRLKRVHWRRPHLRREGGTRAEAQPARA